MMIKKWLPAFIGLSVFAVVGRLLGFFREMLIASNFGATEITDAYLTTLLIFDIAMGANASFLAGTLSFSSTIENQKQNLHSALVKLSLKAFIILLLIALILFPVIKVLVPVIFERSENSIEVITASAQLFLFLTAFLISGGILSAVLQMKGDLVNPGRLIIFLNLFSILFLLLLSKWWGIISVPFGFLVGGLIFLIYQIFLIKKQKIDFISIKQNSNFHTSAWLGSIILIFLNALLPNITGFVERYFSYFFIEGTFSRYIYAGKIILLSMTIFSLAVSTSLLPFQTEAMRNGDLKKFHNATNNGILLTVYISAFFVIIFFLLTQPIVQIVFQRGNFLFTDTIETTYALKILSLALIPFLLVPIINNVFYSYRNLKILILINFVTIILQAALLYTFSTMLTNIQSLVWASVLSAWFNLSLFITYLIASKKLILGKEIIKKILTIVFLMVFMIVGGEFLLGQFKIFESSPQFNLILVLVKTTIAVIILAVIFLLLSSFFLKKSFKELYTNFQNRKYQDNL